jgi:hypothetical protein
MVAKSAFAIENNLFATPTNWRDERARFWSLQGVDPETACAAFDAQDSATERKFLREAVYRWGPTRAALTTDSFFDFLRSPHLAGVRAFETQSAMLTDEAGAFIVDNVLKLETLDRDWAALRDRIRIVGDLPRINASDSGLAPEITEEARGLIEQRHAEDFLNFGYETGRRRGAA